MIMIMIIRKEGTKFIEKNRGRLGVRGG